MAKESGFSHEPNHPEKLSVGATETNEEVEGKSHNPQKKDIEAGWGGGQVTQPHKSSRPHEALT